MSLKEKITSDEKTLNQLAGITGIGWTTSILGFVSTIIGYGSALVANPYSLLYLGSAFFVATVGLDRLRKNRTETMDSDAECKQPAKQTHGQTPKATQEETAE